MRQFRIRSSRRAADNAVFRSNRSGPEASSDGDDAQTVTDIDLAHAAMIEGGDAELFALYRALARSDLHVLVRAPDGSGHTQPKVFPIEDTDYVMVFDTRARAEDFAEQDVAIATQKGEDLMNLLRGQGIGLAVNFSVAPSDILIPGEAIYWICESLANDQQEPVVADLPEPVAADRNDQFKALMAPRNFPDSLSLALHQGLQESGIGIGQALLIWAEYKNGRGGFVVAFSGVAESDRAKLAKTMTRVMSREDRADVAVDVVFLATDDPALERISRMALHLNPSAKAMSGQSAAGTSMELPARGD